MHNEAYEAKRNAANAAGQLSSCDAGFWSISSVSNNAMAYPIFSVGYCLFSRVVYARDTPSENPTISIFLWVCEKVFSGNRSSNGCIGTVVPAYPAVGGIWYFMHCTDNPPSLHKRASVFISWHVVLYAVTPAGTEHQAKEVSFFEPPQPLLVSA